MSKHAPNSREEFKKLILRRLGAPVISVNLSDDQIEDCIEESLKYFTDYHYDGSEQVYHVVTISAQDITNRYVAVPQALFGISEVYTKNQSTYSGMFRGMFGTESEFAIDMTFNTTMGGSMVTYYLNQTQYELINQLLVAKNAIRFNRHLNKLNIDISWDTMAVGDKIIISGHMALDPDTVTDIWNDRWLIKYATAKTKYVWGSVLSKFEGATLPNGVTLNGSKIQDDAKDEIQQLEDEMLSNYSIPPRDLIM
jgi:hypothetical protein